MNNKKKQNNTKGFTLVEVIVVCIILAILIGVAAGGLIAYQRKAMFKKNNEYAQTIFMAAQTAFSQAKDSGQSEELTDLIISEDAKNKLTSSMVKSGAKEQMKEAEAEDARLYYYIFKKGDNKDAYSGAKKMVFEMIKPYIYDADVMNATFCVEFDPSDGVVYSVLYNDRASDFHYGSGESTEKDNGITDRSYDARREILLGYYGVDSLSDQAPGAAKKNLIEDVKLVNGETLELTWTAKQSLPYIYTIKFYDAETKKVAAAIRVNDPDQTGSVFKNGTDKNAFITCDLKLYSYDEKGKRTSKTLKNIKFRANAEGKNGKTVYHLVTDAADLEAARLWDQLEDKEKNDPEKYKDTYSVKRLGIQGSKLYVRMQVSGIRSADMAQKTVVSSWKQTKEESAYEGSEKKETAEKNKDTNVTYEVQNARHLFNIRFLEGSEEQEKKTASTVETKHHFYRQTSDLYWDYNKTGDSQKGIIQRNNVYNKQSVTTNKNFPAIEALHLKNEYSAKAEASDQRYAIIGLHITKDASDTQKIPLGLFRENEGTIQSVEVKSSDITGGGAEYVGMICGVNNGFLTDIEVDKNSKVTGKNYVGGIAGSDITGRFITVTGTDGSQQTGFKYENKRKYENLTNNAEVQGQNFVGGIVGYIYGIYGKDIADVENLKTITLKKCENAGSIQSSIEKGVCIGGIAGYNRKSTLEDCTSTRMLNGLEKNRLAKNAANKVLHGYFVGGIVGYDDGGTFTHCISGSKESVDDYVYGKYYVGGIVGFHTDSEKQGTDADGEDPDKNLTKSSEISAYEKDNKDRPSENNANVTGEKYVGGVTSVAGALSGNIAGVFQLNGSVSADKIEVDKETVGGGVKGFVNRGVVAASDSYAGGIAGYNTGVLLECTTSMLTDKKTSEDLLAFTQFYTKNNKQGHYTGGIAGYNSGMILMAKGTSFSITTGGNYVGGIAGYNDKKGWISSYSVEGGYTSGLNFVGGYIGLNRSNELPMFQKQEEKPEEAEGENEIKPNQVDGALYVGGCIGGNIMSIDGNFNMTSTSLQSISPGCKIAGDAFVGGYVGYNKIVVEGNDGSEIEELAGIAIDEANKIDLDTVRNLVKEKDDSVEPDKEWTISGEKGEVTLEFASITAQIYAGGVFGYNAGDTHVTLYDVTSNTPVTTTKTIEDSGRVYSYAGGIAGHVTRKMELVGCRNLAADKIKSPQAVCLGGLAELNEGTFKNCYVDTIVKKGRDQIGGLVGVNTGTIDQSQTEEGKSISISGRNIVGGLVCYNSGVIQNTVFEGNVEGVNTVGGIAAGNQKEILGAGYKGAMKVSAGQAGGIAGYNEQKASIGKETAFEGTIDGAKLTGGIVGSNAGDISEVSSSGVISSGDEQTGGIAGYNNGTIKNSSLTGAGEIHAGTQTGGIAGSNVGSIENCSTGTNTVIAGTEYTGGIAGIQEPIWTGESKILDSVNRAAVQGDRSVGGIAGYWTSGGRNSECINNKNNGSVRGAEDVGGIVGSIKELRGALTLDNVYNQGAVYGWEKDGSVMCSQAGGIVGSVTSSEDSVGNITISNAVNVGTVASGGTSAGIVGLMNSNNPTTLKLENCRNYGLPTSPTGLAMIADNEFSGIIGQGNGYVTLVNCFGVAGCQYPITKSDKVKDNGSYYFAEKEEEEEETGQVEIADTNLSELIPIHDINEGEMPEDSQLKNLFDGKIKQNGLDLGNTFYYSPKPENGGVWPNGEIYMRFEKPIVLENVEIYWYVRAYQYVFGITAYGESGNLIYESGKREFTSLSAQGQTPAVCELNLKEKVSSVKLTIYNNIYNGGIDEICFNKSPVKGQKNAGINSNVASLSLFGAYDPERGIGTPLYVEGENPPYLASNEKAGIFIEGLSANPLDEKFNSDYSRVKDGSESEKKENLRYWMYDAIDGNLLSPPDKRMADEISDESEVIGKPEGDIQQEEDKKELKEIEKVPVELPVIPAPTVSLADENKDSYLYNIAWQSSYSDEELAAVEKYVVKAKESSGKKNALEQTYETEPGQNQMQIDLEAFAGKKAELSVQAITADGVQNYKDSLEGERTEIQIPKRNETVDSNNIICKQKATDILSTEEFTDTGIQIQVKNPQQKGKGTYLLHAVVYSDADKTEVFEELGEIPMEGSLAESICNLAGLNTDYADKYIGVQVKVISEDMMNSVWSAERMFQLPKIRLKVPELAEGQTPMPYQETRVTEIDGELVTTETEIQAEQNDLSWSPVDYASSYKIDVAAPVKDNPNEKYHLIMTRNAEGDPVSIIKLTDQVDLEGNPIWEELPYVVKDYPDEIDQSLTRVYSYEFQYEREQKGTAASTGGTSYEYQIPLKGFIECHEYLKDGQEPVYTYKLILPDITSEAGLKAVYGSDFRNYLYTNDVTITAVPEEAERYAEANPLKWWRELDEYHNWITKIEEQKENGQSSIGK